jgi:outer membrane protein OmpA-like peptidoglycan-associated protein
LLHAKDEIYQPKYRKISNIRVIVEGHTDEAGTQEYNFVLGDQRAGAVKTFFNRTGHSIITLICRQLCK